MKISILLPTRNRLEFLKFAIETVLRQDCPQWELVVSDNDSSEDIAGHLASIGDERIVYHRTESFLPVTGNWSAALARSSGDYVLMLGDDDGLMPGAVGSLLKLIESFGAPDAIYSSALLLTYPSVLDDQPAGFLMPYGYASFLQGPTAPFKLPREEARKMVEAALDFRLTYGYNAQFLTVSRKLIDRLAPQGPFYQSPFPDYYSTNVAFLEADSIVVEPNPLTLIGVTPKSYGFYYANQREDEGRAFLAGEGGEVVDPELERVLLPGTNINVGWLLAMEAIKRRYGRKFDLKVNRGRFRRLQAAHVYEQFYLHDSVTPAQLTELEARLKASERLLFQTLARITRRLAPLIPSRIGHALEYLYRRSLRQFPDWNPPHIDGSYANVLDAFDHFAGDAALTSQPPQRAPSPPPDSLQAPAKPTSS